MGDIQIIRTPSGDELVVLERADYDALLAAAETLEEDAADVAIFDARKADLAAAPDSLLPEAVGLLLLEGNSRLAAIRLWRGLSQAELATLAGVGQAYLADMEGGRRSVSAEVLPDLAARLNVPPEWIA